MWDQISKVTVKTLTVVNVYGLNRSSYIGLGEHKLYIANK